MNDDALRKRQRIPGIYAKLVQKPGIRPADLARQYGVSAKTIRRDLNDMAAAGVPLFSDNGVWRLVGPRPADAQLDLTISEAVSLFFAVSCYLAMPSPPMAIEVEKATDKLRALLPAGAESALAASSSCYSVTYPSVQGYEGKEEMIDTIEWALDSSTALTIKYVGPVSGAMTLRKVEPYALHFAAGQWYLIGRCRLREDIRMFRVDRIVECHETEDSFERPHDFSVRGYLANAWRVLGGEPVHVIIDFSPQVRPWVGRAAWHPTQKLEEAGDGWLRMHLDVPDNTEVGDWILSFGGGAVAREPESLRRRILAALERGVANYSGAVADSASDVAAAQDED